MLLSLREHAERAGQVWADPLPPDGQRYKWAHRIAALVHGWTLHEHHYADHPIMLTAEDYDAALALASSGSTQAHPAAVACAPEAPVSEETAPEPESIAESDIQVDDEPAEAAEKEVE